MVFGFARQRRQMLEAELLRIAGEIPSLGGRGTILLSDPRDAGPESGLELLVILERDEPYHRRPDFLVSHLRPRVATSFAVFTPEEFETLGERDPVIRRALRGGTIIDEPG
jgi:hypothetical protein